MSAEKEATGILRRAASGDLAAESDLLEIVYDQLRSLAKSLLNAERVDHTLQPTALVHEAYVKLVDQNKVDWKGRSHFIAVAARAMRQILVDHAKRSGAKKRGGGRQRVSLDDLTETQSSEVDYLSLDDALSKLEQFNAHYSNIVQLRFFGGLTVEEVAELTNSSTRSVKRDWRTARAWLHAQMESGGET